ncbi:MAG: hypothetical protein MI810_12580 [Flavobacteriales bacterium]|nr:hypothetical protein [Flavobacteriales bacterium]
MTNALRFMLRFLFLIISVNCYCQCEDNQVVFPDSLGNEISASETDLIYVLENGTDTIHLESLYDSDFTILIQETAELSLDMIDSLKDDSHEGRKKILGNSATNSCVTCYRGTIKVVDSIDVNKDGIKEIFLYREWNCIAPYSHTIPYNPQSQDQSLSQYEVWDIKSGIMLFKVKNTCESTIPVSVNVMTTKGYHSEVTIDPDGSFFVKNSVHHYDFYTETKDRIYRYNSETEKYEKQ